MKQIIGNPSFLIKKLEGLDQDKRYTLKDCIDNRTIQQNSYIHAVFACIGQEWCECPQHVKEYLKSLFLKKYITIKGIEIVVVKGTAKLNKKEFSIFVDQIKLWSLNNLNMIIPSPEDERLEAFYIEYGINH